MAGRFQGVAAMVQSLRTSVSFLVVLTVVTGVAYPLAVTGLAQLIWPAKANGSVVVVDGKAVGSSLIGQEFRRPEHFWGRLSATSPFPYNAGASTGSNLGPRNPDLPKNASARIEALREHDSSIGGVPVDLVTSSGSGLDPHISPAAAEAQVARVSRARGLSEEVVREAIRRHTEGPQFGLLGESRVNTLVLNLDLDGEPRATGDATATP